VIYAIASSIGSLHPNPRRFFVQHWTFAIPAPEHGFSRTVNIRRGEMEMITFCGSTVFLAAENPSSLQRLSTMFNNRFCRLVTLLPQSHTSTLPSAKPDFKSQKECFDRSLPSSPVNTTPVLLVCSHYGPDAPATMMSCRRSHSSKRCMTLFWSLMLSVLLSTHSMKAKNEKAFCISSGR
jgi:hypothetical protein